MKCQKGSKSRYRISIGSIFKLRDKVIKVTKRGTWKSTGRYGFDPDLSQFLKGDQNE